MARITCPVCGNENNEINTFCTDCKTNLKNDSSTCSKLIVSTTSSLDGYKIKEYKGIVRGISVRLPTVSQGIKGNLEGVFGGKNMAYTEVCEQTRKEAYNQLMQNALKIGANAIIGVRYDAENMEVLCYGTGVILEPII